MWDQYQKLTKYNSMTRTASTFVKQCMSIGLSLHLVLVAHSLLLCHPVHNMHMQSCAKPSSLWFVFMSNSSSYAIGPQGLTSCVSFEVLAFSVLHAPPYHGIPCFRLHIQHSMPWMLGLPNLEGWKA